MQVKPSQHSGACEGFKLQGSPENALQQPGVCAPAPAQLLLAKPAHLVHRLLIYPSLSCGY